MNREQENVDQERIALGQRIREAREFIGLSQDDVASVLGIQRPAVTNIESGQRKVEAFELRKLASLLGTTVDFLLTGKRPTEPQSEQLAFLARAAEELTPADMEQLMRFTDYLRNTSNSNRRGQ